MGTERLGIITCSNAVQELDCCSVCCLSDLNKRTGSFKRYPVEDSLRLVGIISCSGCPTLAYPEKILRKVDALAQFGVTCLHFSYCMMALCPFQKKYTDVIRKAYPGIQLVEGTHEEHITREQYREKIKIAFEKNLCMADVISGRV